jgi:hypothetical protein
VRVRDGVLSLNDSIHAAVTDANGRYVIDDLPARDFEKSHQEQLRRQRQASENSGETAVLFMSPSSIEATHPDYAVATAQLRRSPGEVDLQLLPRADLTGRVIDDEGGPISGVRVVISAKKQADPIEGVNNWRPAHAVTGDAGRYLASNLPMGDYEVAAFSGVEGLPEFVPAGPVAVRAEPLAKTGGATEAPDLCFTSGRLVQVQLVD